MIPLLQGAGLEVTVSPQAGEVVAEDVGVCRAPRLVIPSSDTGAVRLSLQQ